MDRNVTRMHFKPASICTNSNCVIKLSACKLISFINLPVFSLGENGKLLFSLFISVTNSDREAYSHILRRTVRHKKKYKMDERVLRHFRTS